jgi:hypothetical protein
MSSADARSRLAARQAELVRALTGQGEPPAGFDPARLLAAARSLARKRMREVARAWPALSGSLGDTFAARFRDFAAVTPSPTEGGPLADGRAFVRTLAAGEWTDAARLEVLAVDLHWRSCPRGLSPRRGPFLTAARLRQARRLVVALRLSRTRVHTLSLPLGWFAGRLSHRP